MVLYLIKSYCLPQSMYACEIWSLNAVNVHLREINAVYGIMDLDMFKCCWQESVKPLQFLLRDAYE